MKTIKCHCTCRLTCFENDPSLPMKYSTVVECNGCERWYHVTCEKIPNDVVKQRKKMELFTLQEIEINLIFMLMHPFLLFYEV